MTDTLPLPQANRVVSDFLSARRSNLARLMSAPGPNANTLEAILETAARVPDHRKLAPWRFLVIEGEMRVKAGEILRARFQALHPDLPEDRYAFEAERFLRAPVTIAVVSSPVQCPCGTPEWEQQLSAGAVCYNMLLAAQSRGFGAQWLTEWYAYDADVLAGFGLSPSEKIAGYIYMGTIKEAPSERSRPDISDLMQTLSL
jgi:nitroreductase